MKKSIVLFMVSVLVSILTTSCSSTWEGIKSDSSSAWKSTKETIHEATE